MTSIHSPSFSPLKEFQTQFKIAFPTTIGLIFYKLPWMISLHFVGVIGSKELAAAALATSLCNVTGLSLSVGLSSAITTLTGQARGHLLKLGLEREQNRLKSYSSCRTSTNISTRKAHYCQYQSKDREDDVVENNFEYHHQGEEKKSELGVINTNNTQLKNNNANDHDENEISSLIKNEIKTELEKGHNDNDHFTPQHDSIDEDDDDESPLLPLVFLYRGLIIQLGIVIPIGLWWIRGIEPMLLYIGQSEELSKMTSIYLRILTPGMWSYSVNMTMTAWLQSIEIADVPAYTAFIGFLCHIPLNVLFVRVLGYGYRGVAMATISFQILQPVLMCVYLFGTNKGIDRMLSSTGARGVGRTKLRFWSELKAAVSSFSGIKQYLELGLPGMIAISEWWASETCIFLAGTLHPNPDYSVGAMSIYQSINTFCFMFPGGFNRAVSARVGMFLGENKPSEAYFASKISLFCAGLLSFTIGNILFFTPHTTFPSLFTSDRDVVLQTSYTIPFLSFYVFADGVQVCLQGTIIGTGKQMVMAPVVLFSYWIVGVPFSYYNTFVRNDDGFMECRAIELCGVRGLVAGLLLGTWIHMLLFMGVFIYAINWKKEASLALKRMTQNEKGSEGG